MEIAVGNYVGNGTSQSISSVPFTPELVWIWDGAVADWFCRTSANTGLNSVSLATGTAQVTNAITALTTAGFTVGANVRVNNNGTTYYWLALKGTDGDFVTSTYQGDGADPHAITGLGFQPEVLFTKNLNDGVNPRAAWWWLQSAATDFGNDASMELNSAAHWTTNRIQDVGADGFTLGSGLEVNRTGVDYVYFAFKIATTRFRTGKYSGNSTDDRDIIGTGAFEPQFVLTKTLAGGVAIAAFRPAGLTGDLSFEVTSASVANRIQALNTDGFQVGTQATVNLSGNTYYYFVFKGTASALSDLEVPDDIIPAGVIIPFAPYQRYKTIRKAMQMLNNLVIGP